MKQAYFALILFAMILVSCAKKKDSMGTTEDTRYKFAGNWNATKNSSATGTNTYTAHFSYDMACNYCMYLYPFSGMIIPGNGVVSIDELEIKGIRFIFSNKQITHASAHVNGSGHLVNDNTIIMQYTITNTSATNTSQEICTETLTR